MAATATATMSETNGTTERIEKVERSLGEATTERQKTQNKIKAVQKELDTLVKFGKRRPREKMSDLEDRVKKLERDRVRVSIPLKQEKEILWQMSRVERIKRQVEEFEAYDKEVKDKKASISGLREEVKKLSAKIYDLRTELTLTRKAKELGCSVEELVGMKVEVPQSKIGRIIGKKGQNVKQLQEKENVSVDVSSKNGAVRLLGSLKSLDAAALDIDRVLALEEQTMDLAEPLVFFLTAKGINALSAIRARHPAVDIDISRDGKCRIRGVAEDIESAKIDIQSVDILEQTLEVSSSESAVVVGKQGVTINSLVVRHQTAFDVTRNKEEAKATIRIVGSVSSVKDASEEIEDLLAQHKEETQYVEIDPVVRNILLHNKGEGVQVLFKLVNERCREIAPGLVNILIEEQNIKIKGKSLVIPKAVEVVSDETRMKEASIVRLPIHQSAIASLVGKGGAGIKKLKDGADSVVLEVDSERGLISVGSLDKPEETDKVVQAVRSFLHEHQVATVNLEPRLFQSQFRLLLGSSCWKELRELVSVSRDDTLFQIVMRGTKENLGKAKEVVVAFVESHFQDEISVLPEDIGVLLRGGKKCKMEELAKEHDLNISAGPDKCSVIFTGNKENVEAAKKSVDCFLNGGAGVKVLRVMVDETSAGVLLGKGGSTKSATEAKFPSVSISILPNQTVVLRGPESDVDLCRKHLAKLLTATFVTEKVMLDEKMQQHAKSASVRAALKNIPVQTIFGESQVILRGSRPDVYYAASQLKEVPGGTYESHVYLEPSRLRKLHGNNRDSPLSSIPNATRTKIGVDSSSSSLIVTGTRNNVISAKNQLVQYLGFLMSETFACLPVPDHAVHFLTQSTQLGAIAEASGAFLYFDHDINSLVVSSQDSVCVEKAKEVFTEKVFGLSSSVYKLDLGGDGDWLAPALIGKGGARVRALRKNWDCGVEVNEKSVTLMSDDSEKLRNARINLDDIIATERAQCFVVELTSENMMAFIGRKGANIKEFTKAHDVQAQALRNKGNFIKVTGSAEAVAKAKDAMEQWLKDREGGSSAVANEDVSVEANDAASDEHGSDDIVMFRFPPSEAGMLPGLIGKGGKRINAIRKRCKCQVELDVEKRFIKITSDDAEVRESAKKFLQGVLDEERRRVAIVRLPEKDVPAFIGAKGSNIRNFEKKHNVRVQVLKNENGTVQISGEGDAVSEAKAALQDWLAGHEKDEEPRDESVPDEQSNAKASESVGVKETPTESKPLPSTRRENRTNRKASERNEKKSARNPMSPRVEDEFPALVSNLSGGASDTGCSFVRTSNSWAAVVNPDLKNKIIQGSASQQDQDGDDDRFSEDETSDHEEAPILSVSTERVIESLDISVKPDIAEVYEGGSAENESIPSGSFEGPENEEAHVEEDVEDKTKPAVPSREPGSEEAKEDELVEDKTQPPVSTKETENGDNKGEELVEDKTQPPVSTKEPDNKEGHAEELVEDNAQSTKETDSGEAHGEELVEDSVPTKESDNKEAHAEELVEDNAQSIKETDNGEAHGEELVEDKTEPHISTKETDDEEAHVEELVEDNAQSIKETDNREAHGEELVEDKTEPPVSTKETDDEEAHVEELVEDNAQSTKETDDGDAHGEESVEDDAQLLATEELDNDDGTIVIEFEKIPSSEEIQFGESSVHDSEASDAPQSPAGESTEPNIDPSLAKEEQFQSVAVAVSFSESQGTSEERVLPEDIKMEQSKPQQLKVELVPEGEMDQPKSFEVTEEQKDSAPSEAAGVVQPLVILPTETPPPALPAKIVSTGRFGVLSMSEEHGIVSATIYTKKVAKGTFGSDILESAARISKDKISWSDPVCMALACHWKGLPKVPTVSAKAEE